MFKNEIISLGKIVKYAENNALSFITVMTQGKDYNYENRSFIRYVVPTSKVKNLNLTKGCFVEIISAATERIVRKGEVPRKEISFNVKEISVVKSKAEELGLPVNTTNHKELLSPKNEFTFVGIVSELIKQKSGIKKFVISIPERVEVVDFRKTSKYENVSAGDVVLVQGFVRTPNKAYEEKKNKEKGNFSSNNTEKTEVNTFTESNTVLEEKSQEQNPPKNKTKKTFVPQEKANNVFVVRNLDRIDVNFEDLFNK